MSYKNFLINEIKRFYDEYGVVPKYKDMKVYNGYPSIKEFTNEFGSWNNAVEAAGFKPRFKRIIGEKVCSICGNKETSHWHNSNIGRICKSCYEEPDYKNGLLDVDSTVGFAFVSQRIVARKLGLELKYDCNCSYGLNYPGFDLLQLDNEEYGKIQVKTSTIRINNCGSLYCEFILGDNSECDTYIMLGFTENKSDVKRVWVIPSNDSIVTCKQTLSITLNPKQIKKLAMRIVEFEVNAKPYNNVYHNMKKLKDCDYLTKYK